MLNLLYFEFNIILSNICLNWFLKHHNPYFLSANFSILNDPHARHASIMGYCQDTIRLAVLFSCLYFYYFWAELIFLKSLQLTIFCKIFTFQLLVCKSLNFFHYMRSCCTIFYWYQHEIGWLCDILLALNFFQLWKGPLDLLLYQSSVKLQTFWDQRVRGME